MNPRKSVFSIGLILLSMLVLAGCGSSRQLEPYELTYTAQAPTQVVLNVTNTAYAPTERAILDRCHNVSGKSISSSYSLPASSKIFVEITSEYPYQSLSAGGPEWTSNSNMDTWDAIGKYYPVTYYPQESDVVVCVIYHHFVVEVCSYKASTASFSTNTITRNRTDAEIAAIDRRSGDTIGSLYVRGDTPDICPELVKTQGGVIVSSGPTIDGKWPTIYQIADGVKKVLG